jgi:hypothetical protein
MLINQDEAKNQQELLDRLCAYLREQFSCVTAILYGSRARGDWDASSDIDVIAFGTAHDTGHIAHRWQNLFLDLFLYPPGTKPEHDWLRIHDGRVLFQQGCEGDEVLAATNDMFVSGPKKMSPSDAQTTRLWLDKMIARAEKGDVEGNYRRHWLLKEILEIYFLLRGRWYLGPKKSLTLLQEQSPEHFEVFRKAFMPNAGMAELQAAVNIANGSD